MAENTLRQALNTVEVVGLVSENTLDYRTNDSGRSIAGELVIETGEGETHTFRFFTNELTRDGNPNRNFASLETVMNEYTSIAKHGRENATKVAVNRGEFRVNDYVGQDGMLRTTTQLRTNFVNRIRPNDTYEPRAEFDVEIFIKAIREEMDREGEETGRVIIDGILPLYGGSVMPISFVVPAGEKSDYVRDEYEVAQTVNIYGEIVNKAETIIKEKKAAFGDSKKTTTNNYIREFVVTGGEEPYDEDDAKSYTIEQIKTAMTERELRLEELKNKPQNNNETKKDKKSGFGNGSKKSDEGDKKKAKVNTDDLPF